jgi:putative FmdB family regulatory protein
MPTYEYKCQKCRKLHEAFQSITAKPLTKCPKRGCGGKLKRLLGSGSGFIFKGSGFYTTDYRKKSYHEARKREEKPSCPSSSSCADSSSCPNAKPRKD